MDKNYAELIFAILERAVMDARGLRLATEYNVDKKQVKNQARDWIKKDECKYMCDVVNFNYKAIERVLG